MNPSGHGRRSILATARRLMQFSVGSALIFQEKTEEFVHQAIERGREAQDEGKKLIQEKRTNRSRKKPERIDALDVRINNALKRLNLSTQKDVSDLNRHITELAERIDELNPDS